MPKYNEQKFESIGLQPETRFYKCGVCKIIVSPPCAAWGWHMSISCDNRDPTWQEIRDAWYTLVPDASTRNGAMFFPPKDEYVNVHTHCFHVHEVPKDMKFCLSITQSLKD